MSLCVPNFKELIVQQTLKQLGCSNAVLEDLLMAIALHNTSPDNLLEAHSEAYGLYGITSQVHRSVWDDFIARDPELASNVRGIASQRAFFDDPDRELCTNLSYATAIAAMALLQQGFPLVEGLNLSAVALADFWQEYFPCCYTITERHKNQFVNVYLSAAFTSQAA